MQSLLIVWSCFGDRAVFQLGAKRHLRARRWNGMSNPESSGDAAGSRSQLGGQQIIFWRKQTLVGLKSLTCPFAKSIADAPSESPVINREASVPFTQLGIHRLWNNSSLTSEAQGCKTHLYFFWFSNLGVEEERKILFFWSSHVSLVFGSSGSYNQL